MPEKFVLRQYQCLPLIAKIHMSYVRIREWYEHWQGDVYVSFSGGKDVQTFTNCYVVLGGKEIVHGAVTNWRDYDNSDVVQVLVDGKYYLTHYTNVVLVADPNQGALTYSDVSYGWDPVNE